ncbi:MAG: hypothetical protein ACPIOQ_69815, partial [Promethearchaeia archaeon]
MDGKLSAVHWRGEVWLFARANLSPTGGARHVQVSHSSDLRSWSSWEALRMEFAIMPSNNIYYLNVQVASDDAKLIGWMPAVIDGSAGVYLSASTNGIDWSKPRLLFASRAVGPRVEDHPIGYDARRHALYVMGPVSFGDLGSAWIKNIVRQNAKDSGVGPPVRILRWSLEGPSLLTSTEPEDSPEAFWTKQPKALPATTSHGSGWSPLTAKRLDYVCDPMSKSVPPSAEALAPRTSQQASRRFRQCFALHFAQVCRSKRGTVATVQDRLTTSEPKAKGPLTIGAPLPLSASSPMPVFATRLELARILRDRRLTVGVELGVRQGSFSAALLAT